MVGHWSAMGNNRTNESIITLPTMKILSCEIPSAQQIEVAVFGRREEEVGKLIGEEPVDFFPAWRGQTTGVRLLRAPLDSDFEQTTAAPTVEFTSP